jgi:hypothetical protein
MKRTTFIMIAILAALSLCAITQDKKPTESNDNNPNAIEAETEGLRSYVIKSKATIEYKGEKTRHDITGTVWHDVEAEKLATETEHLVTFPSGSTLTKNLDIVVGDWRYAINLTENTGRKRPKVKGGAYDDLMQKAKYQNEDSFRKLIEAEGGRILGNETFFERNCLVVETGSGKEKMKIWYYKGIPIKLVTHNTVSEVILMEENLAIPGEKFEVPAGITIR